MAYFAPESLAYLTNPTEGILDMKITGINLTPLRLQEKGPGVEVKAT